MDRKFKEAVLERVVYEYERVLCQKVVCVCACVRVVCKRVVYERIVCVPENCVCESAANEYKVVLGSALCMLCSTQSSTGTCFALAL